MSFDNLPDGWSLTTFENIIGESATGLVRSANEQGVDKAYTYLKMNNLTVEGQFNLSDLQKVDASDDEVEKNQLRINDFLFNTRNSPELVGKCGVWNLLTNYPILFNNNLLRVRFKYINPYIVSYWLNSSLGKNQLRGLVSATTSVAAIYQKQLLKLKLPIPPLAEQQEIVRQLDIMLAQVEQIKARLDAIPAILKKFRQSVLADAMSGKLLGNHDSFKEIIVENTWKHSIYGLEHWKEYKFADVVDIVGGSQPPKSDFRAEYQDGYIRLIQIRDYKSDSHIVYIPKEKAKRFVNATDVMIGRYGPPIFQILRGLEGAYNVALMKAEPKDQLIDQEYLYWYLQNYKIYNYIEAGSDRTAGQSGVNKKHLEAYPILLPSIEEQQNIVKEIVKLITLANRIEETVKSAQKRVNLLTQSILAKAFSGELTTEWREQHQDLITGINSAEALLAKIQAEREANKPVKKIRAKKEA
jgi:type I restriction enzyme S subunit